VLNPSSRTAGNLARILDTDFLSLSGLLVIKGLVINDSIRGDESRL
jgi:hypothetical protein